MNVAIYLRVSTDKQDEANQEPDCRRLAEARGWPDAIVFAERESGAKARPVWGHLLELAHQGKVNAIVVWSLDRVGRTMWRTIDDVRALERSGCRLLSVRESWLDTGGPAAPLLLAIFAWVADHERRRLIDRTNAGIARARARGAILGRPRKWVDPVRLKVLRGRGVTVLELARRFQVSVRTVRRALAKPGAAKNGTHLAARPPRPASGRSARL
jgi:putative DNA-invertase from lambdoid prophage Rac